MDANSAFLSWSAAYRVYILGEKQDLRTVPSVVGGDEKSRHGIVLAKSLPAKRYGIQTGEALVTARQKCPGLMVIPPDYGLYVAASRAFIGILREYSDRVIQYSIDEAWAEFDGYERLYGPMTAFAEELREEIGRRLGFTVNIGISTNRLLAKMAGEFRKPDRVHTLYPEELPEKLWPLPVEELFFVGRATAKKLHTLGIHTIGELAAADEELLKAHLKKQGEVIRQYARGEDLQPYIFAHPANKGYGDGMTAPVDVMDWEYARQILLSLCETLGTRLRADGVQVSQLRVSVTTNGFERSGCQRQLAAPTDVTEELWKEACGLLQKLWRTRTPLRQLCVHGGRVQREAGRQQGLFDQAVFDRYAGADRAVDGLRHRYGETAVFRASFLQNRLPVLGGGLARERRTGVTAGILLEKEWRPPEQAE